LAPARSRQLVDASGCRTRRRADDCSREDPGLSEIAEYSPCCHPERSRRIPGILAASSAPGEQTLQRHRESVSTVSQTIREILQGSFAFAQDDNRRWKRR